MRACTGITRKPQASGFRGQSGQLLREGDFYLKNSDPLWPVGKPIIPLMPMTCVGLSATVGGWEQRW